MKLGITGHRDFKLNPERQLFIESMLHSVTEMHIGMALGFDLYMAHVAIQHNIPFVAHVPYPNQEYYWKRSWKMFYLNCIDKAQHVITYSPNYDVSALFIRNKAIIDNSDSVLTYYDGRTSGGTYHAISYAVIQNKEIIYVL